MKAKSGIWSAWRGLRGGARTVLGAELMVTAVVLLYLAYSPYRCASTCFAPAAPLFSRVVATELAILACFPIAALVFRPKVFRWLGGLAAVGVGIWIMAVLFVLPYPRGDNSGNIDLGGTLFILPILFLGISVTLWGLALSGRGFSPRPGEPGRRNHSARPLANPPVP